MNKFFLFVWLCVALTACTVFPRKDRFYPNYKGVNPIFQKYVDQFKLLGEYQGYKFKNTITMGFEKIVDPRVIGLCHYGLGWREVDIDTDFWNNSTEIRRNALILHELGHCLCDREHDYGKNLPYSYDLETLGPLSGSIFDAFYEDSCPKSIMYPEIISSECYLNHYGDYIKELFNRCEPY